MSGLDEMIASFRNLETLEARTAALAAPLLEKASKEQVAKGLTPEGTPWAPKKDGSRALVNAAEHVHAETSGETVTLVVDGPEFFHQTVKEGGTLPRRKLIPGVGDALPPHLRAALDTAGARAFSEITGGR